MPCKQSLLSYLFAWLAVSIDRHDYLVGRFHLSLRGYKHCLTLIFFLRSTLKNVKLTLIGRNNQTKYSSYGVFMLTRKKKELLRFLWFISYPWEIFPLQTNKIYFPPCCWLAIINFEPISMACQLLSLVRQPQYLFMWKKKVCCK